MKEIIVCDKCLKASCWYGDFMCEDAKSAGTKRIKISDLIKLNLEDSYYWSDMALLENYGAVDI